MADREQRQPLVRRRGVHDGHVDDDSPRRGHPLDDADWIHGGTSRQRYASPWAVATPKHAALVRRQGRLDESFVRTAVDPLEIYLEPPPQD